MHALQIKKTAKRGAFRALLGSLPHIVIEAAKTAAIRTRAHLIQLPAVYHNQTAMSAPNPSHAAWAFNWRRMLKSDGVFFTFPPRHSACTAEPTEKKRRQGNEPTYDALDKSSESQARRGIIQAESVRRIPCRKHATDRQKVKKTPSLFHLQLQPAVERKQTLEEFAAFRELLRAAVEKNATVLNKQNAIHMPNPAKVMRDHNHRAIS